MGRTERRLELYSKVQKLQGVLAGHVSRQCAHASRLLFGLGLGFRVGFWAN